MQETHDLSRRTWGNNYNVHSVEDKGHTITISGWRKNIKIKDYIILKQRETTTRYQVQEIKYQSDPDDMFFALATFAPRDH